MNKMYVSLWSILRIFRVFSRLFGRNRRRRW